MYSVTSQLLFKISSQRRHSKIDWGGSAKAMLSYAHSGTLGGRGGKVGQKDGDPSGVRGQGCMGNAVLR